MHTHKGKVKTNPQYSKFASLWCKQRDCFSGEDTIKCKDETYLKKTAGMRNCSDGHKRYEHYKDWAIFYEYPQAIGSDIFGLLNKEPAMIDVEDNQFLLDWLDNVDQAGANIQGLIQNINQEQIQVGRVGYLVDVTDGTSPVPRVVKYKAECILDWNYTTREDGKQKLAYVLLNETGIELNTKTGEWDEKPQFRVCRLDANGNYITYLVEDCGNLMLDKDFEAIENVAMPNVSGNTLDFVPFVFANSTHNMASIENGIMLPICNMSLALYKSEADLRQQVHEQGEQTLALMGFTEYMADNVSIPLGSGAVLATSATPQEADAKYIGIDGNTIEQCKEIQNDLHKRIISQGVNILEGGNDSGYALSIKMTTKTANIKGLALTCGRAIEQMLTIIKDWFNLTVEVSVKPNTDFADTVINAKEIGDYWSSIQMGAPLSEKSCHAWARRNNFTEMTYQQEMEAKEEESEV